MDLLNILFALNSKQEYKEWIYWIFCLLWTVNNNTKNGFTEYFVCSEQWTRIQWMDLLNILFAKRMDLLNILFAWCPKINRMPDSIV